MKKLLAMILVLAMSLSLVACGGSDDTASGDEGGAVDSVYAGFEPVELIGADSTGKGAAGQIFGEYVAERVSEITG